MKKRFLFLFRRYSTGFMDVKEVRRNIRILMQLSEDKGLDASSSGKLRILSSRRDKILFSLRNMLTFGAYQYRVERVVYYSLAALTIEIFNPFDKQVLMDFLWRKKELIVRLLSRNELLNNKKWDQSNINIHLDAFHRASLVQFQVISNMQKAVKKQGVPQIIKEVQEAVEKGLMPILITEGSSGSYWMRSKKSEVAGLFKPFDEELFAPNNPVGPIYQGALGGRMTRLGCRVGEAPHHEVAAYLVDAFFGFGIIPRTYYAEFTHRTFFLAREDRLSSFRPKKTKIGSFQEFIGGYVTLSKILEERDALPLVDFQLLIVLDVIIGNTDRNSNNILIGAENIAAIDHGLCFPDKNYNLSYWYWIFEMGKKPLISSLMDLLTNFPFEELSWKLRKNCFISVPSLARLRERVILFREGLMAGLVPSEMIELMDPQYLEPLENYSETLQERSQIQVGLYKKEKKLIID